MDVTLTDEQRMLRDMFREFATNDVAPLARELDVLEQPPLASLKKAAGLDLLGIALPEQYGGMNAGWLAYGLLMEELGRVCLSTAVAINAHTSAAVLIATSADEEQKRRLLPPLATGRQIAACAITEPDATDASDIACAALQADDGFVLRGRKASVINGDHADVFVVAAREPAGGLALFVATRAAPGFAGGWRNKQMGLRAAAGSDVFFDNCRVAPSGRLQGDALHMIVQARRCSRLGLAFASLGIAERGLADSLEFARNRQQFGGPVARKQIIQGYLAGMAAQIESLRCLAHRCAAELQHNSASDSDVAMLKLEAGQTATRVINKTVQIHGGMGYIKSYHVERLYRDVRAVTVLEGSSETQRLAVAAELLRPLGINVAL